MLVIRAQWSSDCPCSSPSQVFLTRLLCAAALILLVAGSPSGIAADDSPPYQAPTAAEADKKANDREIRVRRDLAAGAFTIDLAHAVCPGLVARDLKSAPNAEACESICNGVPKGGCDAWQFCPLQKNSCQKWDGSWSLSKWEGRCFIATSSSSRGMCKYDVNGYVPYRI